MRDTDSVRVRSSSPGVYGSVEEMVGGFLKGRKHQHTLSHLRHTESSDTQNLP